MVPPLPGKAPSDRGEGRRKAVVGSRLRLLLLLAVTGLPAVVEAAVLLGTGFRPSLGLSVLSTAPAPYGSLHDMLWLLVYHNSWPGLVLELAAAILFRGLLGAAAVALAWPASLPRPPVRRLIGRNLAFAAICAVIISPWAAVAMAAVAIALSWFVFGELVPLLLFAPVLQRGGICTGWWRGLPPARLVALAPVNFVVLTVTGTLVWRTPGWWAVLAAAGAGAVNGGLWWYLVRAAVLTPVRLPRMPTVPTVAATVVAAMVLIGGGAGFGGSGRRHDKSVPPPAAPETRSAVAGALHHVVLYVAGYDSAYDGQPPTDPRVAVFSYRGLDPAGNPLPYPPDATHQAVRTSAGLLAAQVDREHQRTGKPVAIVGISEGALITRKYLQSWPHHNVDAAALISPVVRPGQVYYPPPQASHGWGLAAGWELRGVLAVIGLRHATPISADEPFIRSVLADAPFFRNRMLCPVPGVRMMAFLPSADAATIPPGAFLGIPADNLPAFHGGLVGYPAEVQRLVEFLNGTNTGGAQHPYYPLVQTASGVWQAPVLALSINPIWHAPNQPDAALHGTACPNGD
jgi:hypothetical protein